MMFGLTDDQQKFIKNELKKQLSENTTVWCFGSRARGDFKPFSDLDLMIDSKSDQQQSIGKLDEVFEESSIPIKIDLVQLQNFAETYKDSFLRDRMLFIEIPCKDST